MFKNIGAEKPEILIISNLEVCVALVPFLSTRVFNPRNYLGFLDLFFSQSELTVGVFSLSLSLLLTSFSLLPKIKPEPTLYAKINMLLKYIVSCLHRKHEFPSQMVVLCVCTMTQALAFVVIDQCYFEDS